VPSPSANQPANSAVPAQAAGPLFVVSMWRSGSSLLYALLNKHPQVGLMYEADLLLLRSAFLKPGRSCDWASRWEFWNQAFTRHGLDVQDFNEGITDFPRAFEAAHKEFARRKGATIWGDKSPNYYDRLQEMAETFPDAKFIIVWRDPAGTANSILRAAQSGNSYFKRPGSTLRGLIGYEVYKQQHDWLVAHGRAVYDVSYEDLVRDTPSIMQEVCRFLQIPYHEDLANLQGADRSAIYGGQHHAFVKGDKIVSGPRPNVVDDNLRTRIDRYLAFWRERYAGNWPPYPSVNDANVVAITLGQRLKDKLTYRALRAFDSFTAFCFSMAPLSLLQAYRNRKYRGKPQAPSAKAETSLHSHSQPVGAKEV
jgi:LPS sulfotransferase NodH